MWSQLLFCTHKEEENCKHFKRKEENINTEGKKQEVIEEIVNLLI